MSLEYYVGQSCRRIANREYAKAKVQRQPGLECIPLDALGAAAMRGPEALRDLYAGWLGESRPDPTIEDIRESEYTVVDRVVVMHID